MNDVIKYIKNLNVTDEYIVLACSYGPDSMVLLDLLQKENLNVVVAHINHKLRIESDEEEKDLKEYCLKHNLILETSTIDKYPKGNIENNARIFRYNFFEKVLKKYNSKYLFTAHHGDDLIETIIMRLSRGSSFKGYAGFSDKVDKENYKIFRPLINVDKEEILNYAKENYIPYAIDQTNHENIYTRNKIRNNILPILKKDNKNLHKKFYKFSELINDYEEYFNKETNNLYSELYINNKIDLNEFYLIDKIFKKRLLDKILFNIYNNDINIITDTHTNLIIDLIDSHKQNSYVVLPKNVRITKFYNMLEFDYHSNIDTSYNYLFKNEVKLPVGKIIKIENTDIIKSNDIIRLSSEEIRLPIYIRTRKNGDRISIKNLHGTKKIKDVFIENKLSTKERDIYPIVTDSAGEILWIPGIKKSKFDKQKEDSYDIILKYEKKENE